MNLAGMLMTGGAPAGEAQQGNPLSMLLFFVAIFAIFYLLIIRPQQKRAKEHRKMLEDIKAGDRVVTVGGLIGNVVGTKEEDGVQIVVLKIAENTKVEVARGNIQQVLVKQR
jgi:preprotein translocase subunit YajC